MFYHPVGSFLLPLSSTHGVLSSLCFPGYSCVFIFLTCQAPFKSSLEFLLELHYTCKLTGRTDIWRTSRHPNQKQEMLFPLFNYSAGYFFSSSYFLLSLHCLFSKGDRVFFVCPFLSRKYCFFQAGPSGPTHLHVSFPQQDEDFPAPDRCSVISCVLFPFLLLGVVLSVVLLSPLVPLLFLLLFPASPLCSSAFRGS